MSHLPAPSRNFRPQSERQRRAVLARIDAAERETLASQPAPLTADPYLLRAAPDSAVAQASRGPTPVPLRLIKRAEPASDCSAGTCPLTPGCAGRCYLHQAHQALRGSIDQHTGHSAHQRASLPEPVVPIDHTQRRLVWTGIALYMLGMVAAGIWAFAR